MFYIHAHQCLHRERSYRLFSHLTCRWESATMKALMSMNIKHANWSRNNESICFLSFVYFLVFLTSFFAIHYYKISKYTCKSTIIISEKRTIASKCLRLVSLIDRNLYFGVTSSVLLEHHCRFSGAQKCSCPGAKVPLPWHNSALP